MSLYQRYVSMGDHLLAFMGIKASNSGINIINGYKPPTYQSIYFTQCEKRWYSRPANMPESPPAIAGGYCHALWRAWAVEPRPPFRMRVGLSVQLVPLLHCGWTACLSAGFSAQGRWSTGERPGAKKFPAAVHPIYSNRQIFMVMKCYYLILFDYT